VKILHILDHSIPLHSGYTFRTRAILDQQRALGWETEHLTSTKQRAGGGGAAGGPVEEVDGLRFHRTLPAGGLLHRLPVMNQVAVVRDLRRRLEVVVRETSPDLIHAHSPALNGVAALLVARKVGLPVVYEVRAFWEDAAVDHGTTRAGGLRYRATRHLETWVLRRADAITTICEGLRQDILARGIPESRVTVIPNAVDVARFRVDAPADASLRSSLRLDGCRVLGFVGSFYGYEGLSLLLDAMPGILRAVPETRLLLVGGGIEEARMRAKADALGLGEAIRLPGRVPNAEVDRYYSLCDIMVYPRLAMRLTDLVTPLKPLEAMAQGKIVLASDVGGHRELVRDGETGVLFEAGSVDALTRAAIDLLRHPERWPALRRAGRTFVERERTWALSVARYRPLYERLRKPVALARS